MSFMILAIVMIFLGLVVRAMAPTITKAAPTGSAATVKLLSYGLMFAGLVIALMNAVVVIEVGQVGVQHFLGRINSTPLESGTRLINPFASVERMSIREQSFPPGGGVERIEAQTSEQLNVSLEVAILYRIEASNSPNLYRTIGTEAQITSQIILNSIRTGVRDAIATKSINEIFSPDRLLVAEAMRTEVQNQAGDRIVVVEVFLRDVQAPERVRVAIEERLQREQNVAAEVFQTEIIQERARQQVEEAKGIAEAQLIISEGLTPEYLTFFYIEQLGQLPAGSVIYVPTEGGIPLMRNLGGG